VWGSRQQAIVVSVHLVMTLSKHGMMPVIKSHQY